MFRVLPFSTKVVSEIKLTKLETLLDGTSTGGEIYFRIY